MKVSRRKFLESSAATVAVTGRLSQQEMEMSMKDGPTTDRFSPLPLKGNTGWESIAQMVVSDEMKRALTEAPRGKSVAWGIPFEVSRPVVLLQKKHSETIPPTKAQWLVFLHTSDLVPQPLDSQGLLPSKRGQGALAEHVADYIFQYSDGKEIREKIKRRHHLGMIQRHWGENCFQSVAHSKPYTVQPVHESIRFGSKTGNWGTGETRVNAADQSNWMNWLWAWENPFPEKTITGIRFEPVTGLVIISGLAAGSARELPIRWRSRQKAVFKIPEGQEFDYALRENGLLGSIQLDMGQVISAEPVLEYPNEDWESSYNNQLPTVSRNSVLVEFTAHPDARFHFQSGEVIPVSDVQSEIKGSLSLVKAAEKKVKIRIIDRKNRKLVPVKLHVHGEHGEYLAPVDRHRQPNSSWFEDYCAEFQHNGIHRCVYIPGETTMNLPLGKVFLEVSKGFEMRPFRKVFEIAADTDHIEIEIEKVLDWREKGWVTADTHVHFLSPQTAGLEGSAEGVNVVNLLSSQWGELMTNVGDFDGETTFGSREAGGDGEWLVRVGTENRQHVLGHISLLGYKGGIIAPMCCGGPDEAALGDPVDILLMEWAEKCRKQGGLAILPHFPNPRCENAADIIGGNIDAIEWTSWGNLYAGIDPYSLADYYRYLNLGCLLPAVGGTDKMSASTAVGTVRTYARISKNQEFNYQSWLSAIKTGHTFVTYGPLLEFTAEGQPPGSIIKMESSGGTVDIVWQAASVTVPMSRIELIINGEVKESSSIKPDSDSGHWTVKINESSWLAILLRGHYEDKPEIIAAHSSPVVVKLDGSEIFFAPDAIVTLDQIEGAVAYLETVGTRADEETYRRMKLKLTSVYRELHNELHRRGHYHEHTRLTDHPEHHG